jgi:TP901 family phage tail tape measure protein
MSLNTLGLGLLFTAKDEASAVIGKLETRFGKLAEQGRNAQGQFMPITSLWKSNLAQAVTGLGMLAVGVKTVHGLFEMAGEAGKFQQVLAGVGKIAGANAAELKAMHDATITAGIQTQFNPIEAAEALREISAQGYNAKEAIDLLRPTLDLAAASLGELDPKAAAGLAAQTLKAFGIEAGNAAPAVDKLMQAANMFALAPRELPEAVGIASRGAQILGASLDETLVTVGLVKNIIPGIERASTGVAVAMERLANAKAQKAMAGIGVSVANADGTFRPFLDTVLDLQKATDNMSKVDAAGFLEHTFGAHAVGPMMAIMTQLKNGVRGVNGEMLYGADAVDSFRKAMAKSEGVAAGFKDALLNTYEGQQTLLRGSTQTLRILVGEGIAAVLKPLVSGWLAFVNILINFVQKIPDPVKQTLAKIVLVVASVTAAIGAFIMLKGALVILGGVMALFGVTISGVLASLLPVVAVFAAVAGAAYVMYYAITENIGGLGDFFGGVFGKVKLAFEGIMQLFQSGAFSGQVMEELNKAGNGGVKDFVIKVFVWFERIKLFFSSLIAGFKAGLQFIAPVFEILKNALGGLLEQFGIARGSAEENASTWDSIAAAGTKVGTVLAVVAELFVRGLTFGIQMATGAIQFFKDVWETVGPVVMSVWQIIKGVVEMVGAVLTGDWALLWNGAVDIVMGAIRLIIQGILSGVGMMGKIIDSVGSVFGKDLGASAGIAHARSDLDALFERATNAVKVGPSPAKAAIEAGVAANGAAAAASQGQTKHLTVVNIDGKKVAEVLDTNKRNSKAREFMPVPGAQ